MIHRFLRPLAPTLALAATLATALAMVAQPASAEPPAETRLLQVILLSASSSGTSDLAALPTNARKAIDDISAFLPFRSYRLLDTGLIRSDSNGRTSMRGVDGAEYEVGITFHAVAGEDGRKTGRIQVRRFVVVKIPSRSRMLLEPPRTDRSGNRTAPLDAPVNPRTLISTSFTAEVGNTTVVGSSRLNGSDQALVVLFTALP